LNNEFIWTVYGHPWLFDSATLNNLIEGEFQNEGTNNSSKQCVSQGDFCFMLFNLSSAPSIVGISFTPGNAIIIYLPGYQVSDNCFAYYIYDRATDSPIIGHQLSGC